MAKKGKGHKRDISLTQDKIVPERIREAFNLISSHRAIVPGSVTEPMPIEKGMFRFEAVMEVALPSRAKSQGVTKTGVRGREPIILDFPQEYPFLSPIVKLRKDFNRTLPHINPGIPDDYVRPCIYEGDLNELLHQENGIYAILDQLSEWLKKAAADHLIDPKQGWEPIRRDDLHGVLCFDMETLRGHITDKEDFVTFLCYFRSIPVHFVGFTFKNDISRHIRYKTKKIELNVKNDLTVGVTLGILCWPPAFKTDKSIHTTNTYLPETVTKLSDLLDRARIYGCYSTLNERLQELYLEIRNMGGEIPDGFPIVIVLCARRQFHLINENSKLELIPYLLKCKKMQGPLGNIDADSPVYPLGHRHALSTNLLRKLSGSQPTAIKGSIIQVGCGSLGSKIILHLARAGHGPFTLIDNKYLSPHNVARHALININEFTFFKNKAEELKNALSVFPQCKTSPVYTDNLIELLFDREKAKMVFGDGDGVIIDSTASLAVREAFAATDKNKISHRIIQTMLYSNGECGISCVEGLARNPRIDDLVNKLYDCCIDDKLLSKKMFTAETGVTRQAVGQGCDSYTMVMPDTRVSIFAAAMAEQTRQQIEEGLPRKGLLNIGLLAPKQSNLIWRTIEVGETTVLNGVQNWEIRLLENVIFDMAQEALKRGSIETGGVMIGRISTARRCMTITRLLPAPPDSKRSEAAFILGTEGLREMVRETQTACSNLLSYVGTWHSHPRGGGPSTRDDMVLKRMKELRLGAPAICLVWTSTGFYCLMDEGDFRTS